MQDVQSSLLHRILQTSKFISERKIKMKKKILALFLAMTATVSATAYASGISVVRTENTLTFEKEGESIAVVSCFDEDGKLCYGNMYQGEDGKFTVVLPDELKGAKTKIYFVNSNEIKEAEFADEELPTPTVSPEPTLAPEATVTPEPTLKPSDSGYPSIYEKTTDAVYAPVVVKDVELTTKDGEDMYAVTVLGYGEEKTVLIENDLKFETSSEQYADMKNSTAIDLQTGDVISLTANVAGTRINHIYFIYRPVDEDLANTTADYGTNFEKLISENGTNVAGKWDVMKYGVKPSSERYQYALGIIGKTSSGTLTLINKSGDTNKAIDIDVSKDTIVYTCYLSGDKEVELSSVGEISSSIPKALYDKNDIVTFEAEEEYNYALVRVVNGTATDIVVYENED